MTAVASIDADACTYRPRQLVVCCDGTNNTLTAHATDTNVLRLYEHLQTHRLSDPACERLLYYDPGVGSPDSVPPTDLIDWAKRIAERLSGLASGRGVYDNIAEAYRFLMLNWRDERDRIYCFGFSRGAFTARCVVGMVNLFGLLKPEHEVMLPTLIRIYFSLPSGKGRWWQALAERLHRALSRRDAPGSRRVTRDALATQVGDDFAGSGRRDAWVHWVGVWDTVESVGLPGPLSRSNPSTATLAGKRIRHVRHALAFDEHRWTFEPRLYEEPGDIDGPPSGQTLRQRWFPGVHCDIGGGYPRGDAGLADAALTWMVAEMAHEFPGLPPLVPEPARCVQHDALWDTPWWALAGMCLRDMRPKTAAHASAAPPRPIEVVAESTAAVPTDGVWQHRRKAWPVWAAIVAAAVCRLLSGACLLPAGRSVGWWSDFAGAAHAAHRASFEFALDQLAAFGFGGGMARWDAGQPAWAMFWDCGFAVCYGYLVARVASRSFAWLAGRRRADAPVPPWHWLGMAPLALVGGDVAENLLTLAGLAWRGLGSDGLAAVAWCFGAGASLVKFAGLLGCMVWLAVRLWIALPGVPRWRG